MCALIKNVFVLLQTILLIGLVNSIKVEPMPTRVAEVQKFSHPKPADAFGVNTSAMKKRKATINLGIFCDAGFVSRFQNNGKDIKKYWEATLYELHIMFKTLPSFDITFQVTSLHVIRVNNGH